MNWEYQQFVKYFGNGKHYGFHMDNESPIVMDWNNHEHQPGTAVGVLKYGKGRILFSTLSILDNLADTEGTSAVPKKVFNNMLKWAANPQDE